MERFGLSRSAGISDASRALWTHTFARSGGRPSLDEMAQSSREREPYGAWDFWLDPILLSSLSGVDECQMPDMQWSPETEEPICKLNEHLTQRAPGVTLETCPDRLDEIRGSHPQFPGLTNA